jgi:hypothetical protein
MFTQRGRNNHIGNLYAQDSDAVYTYRDTRTATRTARELEKERQKEWKRGKREREQGKERERERRSILTEKWKRLLIAVPRNLDLTATKVDDSYTAIFFP